MTRRHRLPRALSLPAIAILAAVALFSAWGAATPSLAAARSVSFDGKQVRVPAGYSVLRLAQHPRLCVRLDRRAVYLGTPSPNQSCPADALGRRRAILVEPSSARAARSPIPVAPRATASAGGGVFTGLGFDACSAPSSSQMRAWGKSPYRAVGVYIGGINRACSQPALTSSWVAEQTANEWHLIPTYVGLQAPTSSCGSCGKLNANQATAQGAAAAADAVVQAGAIAIGPGSPIYFDMESCSRTASGTAATMAFLEAWTEKLHTLGYDSGVYSSSASGIADLADQIGTGYTLPDAIWTANWNGQQNTLDPELPAGSWSPQRRIHQYRGGHDETWGGTTINIDNNYADGPTVSGASVAGEEDPIGNLDLSGSPQPGQVRIKGWAFDPDGPLKPVSIRMFVGGRAGSPNALEYEFGPIATGSRADVATLYPEAGPLHGFDVALPTVKSGPQPVCVYAVNFGLGADRLLACKNGPDPGPDHPLPHPGHPCRSAAADHLRLAGRSRLSGTAGAADPLQGRPAPRPRPATAAENGQTSARPAPLHGRRQTLPGLRDPAHPPGPIAATRARQAADPGRRRDPRRPAGQRPADRAPPPLGRSGEGGHRAIRRAPRAGGSAPSAASPAPLRAAPAAR